MMKILIGKYTDFIGPYQIAEIICKPLWWLTEDQVHNFGEWLSNDKHDNDSLLTTFCQWVYYKRKRTVKIHIDKYDTWNMESTLALIILPMLKQLQKEKHGAPGDMDAFQQTSNQSQGSFDFYAEGDDAAWEIGHDQWTKIMDEMIWAFEQLQPDCEWEDQYWKVRPELDLKDYPEDEGKVCIPVRWKVEGECDWEGMRKHQDRIQKGLEMFGKYYSSLWD